MSKANLRIYVLGTAGAGKSSLVGAYGQWCRQNNLDAVLVNLDPGAEHVPYTPDVDVRDWVRLADIMAQEGLGPNGAQIAASDVLALKAHDLNEAIDGFQADVVLIDAPGQIELFVFRQSGPFIVEQLGREASLVAYLVDPMLARQASGLVSQFMLAASVRFRLGLPITHILSKSDLVSEQELEQIGHWAGDPDALQSAVMQEDASAYRELNVDLLRSLEGFGAVPGLSPVSVREETGLEDLYAAIQMVYGAGEDITADAVDSVDPPMGQNGA